MEENAKCVFENNKNIVCDIQSKIVDGKIIVGQGVVDSWCAGSFENIYTMGKMAELTVNLLLQVASAIRDEVTTTDELIPSGEIASCRSNPEQIRQFILTRKDPNYVGRTKEAREFERARMAGVVAKAVDFYAPLKALGIDTTAEELIKTTGISSLLYAKRPGDGSAREYAASCQKVLGSLANIYIEYATKRYRSNCVNRVSICSVHSVASSPPLVRATAKPQPLTLAANS